MTSSVFASLILVAQLAGEPPRSTLTFAEAVARASAHGSANIAPPPVIDLRRSRLPDVRIEAGGNASRTLDLFSEGPLEVRFATSVLAFDYPMLDGGAAAARHEATVSRIRRMTAAASLDDTRFIELLDAFGDLYVAQKQAEVLTPVARSAETEAERSEALLASGEISNLAAADRRELHLQFETLRLDNELRRVSAASRLRRLTGLETEPAVVLDPSAAAGADRAISDAAVSDAASAVLENRARVREVDAASKLRATLSGFAGFGAAQSEFRKVQSDGAFGVYGLRILFSYPLFGGSNALARAEARAALHQSIVAEEATRSAVARRIEDYRLRASSAEQRLGLLRRSIAVAREREESLQRLVAGGLRSEKELAQVQTDRVRREIDLLAAEVELWKASQLLARVRTEQAAVSP